MTAELFATSPLHTGELRAGLQWLAERDVFIGTSSWKYEGWLGQLYELARYETRGRFSKAKFDRECLTEHAEFFRTVCVDAGYYRFPDPDWITKLMEQTPPGYLFTFKVTDDITMRTFPKLPRYAEKGGHRNPHFLDAELFHRGFLTPLYPWKERVGVLIFEFSHFHPRDFDRGRDFVDGLHHFLSLLPHGWRYGVEIRNKNLLHPDYFDCLRHHGVAHVFNQWTHMPNAIEQMALPHSQECANFTAGRFLLKQGRSYEEAVQMFTPYNGIKEAAEEARKALVELMVKSLESKRHGKPKPTFLYVNNRLEGNALQTIFNMIRIISGMEPGVLPDQPPPGNPPATLL